MRIFLTGASSQLGHAFLAALPRDAHAVTALSRQPIVDASNVRWLRGSLPDAVPEPVDADAIISFGPIDALAEWLEHQPAAPARVLVATSSMSAVSKQDASEAADRDVSARLRVGESSLIAACQRHGVRWTILRPTMIYGVALDRNLTPIARRARRWRVFPIPPGRGLRQPVHAQDVAAAALAAVQSSDAAGRIIEIGGGERIPVVEMFRRVHASLQSGVIALPVPRWLLPMATALLPRLRGALSRLDQDLIADNGELQRLLHVSPRGFAPTAATWESP